MKNLLLNLQTLARGIPGLIPGGISTKDFSMATQSNEDLAVEILDNFIQNGIGTFNNELFYFKENDRLKAGLFLINMGAPIDEISRLLNWKDFETLVAEILENRDFETSSNVILTKPRMQIDVVGIKSGIALLIDCKHWNYMTQSSLENAVKKQIARTRQFLSKKKVQAAIPSIVTLYQQEIKLIDKVPIIPIYQLDTFCDEFYGNLESLY